MAPYKLQLIQQLKNTDKPARRDFCIAMPEKLRDDGFDDRLVFSDEATSPDFTSSAFFFGRVSRFDIIILIIELSVLSQTYISFKIEATYDNRSDN